jgi:hypothetical protein
MAYIPVAGQGPRCKQRDSAVNTFPWQRLHMQRGGNGMLSTRSAPRNYKNNRIGATSSLELCKGGWEETALQLSNSILYSKLLIFFHPTKRCCGKPRHLYPASPRFASLVSLRFSWLYSVTPGTSLRPQELPSKSFLNHYSPMTLQFDATISDTGNVH